MLNREKSKGLRQGNQRAIEDNFENICWNETTIKTLGVHFGLNKEKTREMNWLPKWKK